MNIGFWKGIKTRCGLGVAGVGETAPWYRAGGAPAPIAVWWAKGAASLAASVVNLVTPGTHDLTPAGANNLLEANGWPGGTTWFTTDIVPALTYTFIVRFSGQNDAIRVFGGCVTSASQNFYIRHSGSTNTNFQCGNNNVYVLGGFREAGVYCMAGKTIFLDGVQGTSVAAGGSDPTHALYLMALNNAGTGANAITQGHIQGAAVWNSTLTPAQAAAVSATMAAL